MINFKDFYHQRLIIESARIQHAEDVIFWEGAEGAIRVIDELKQIAQGSIKNISVKFDGSPAIIFGRKENGDFILTDKSGFAAKGYDGRPTSPEAVYNMFLARPGAKGGENLSYVALANNMAKAYSLFEQATPKDLIGFFKGDVLYFETPPLIDKYYIFTPNIVTYQVKKNSDLGNQISKSEVGVVIHRRIAEDGSEHPLTDYNMFEGNDVLIIPPVYIQTPIKLDVSIIDRLMNIAQKNRQDINSFFNDNTLKSLQLSDLPQIFYTYVNSKVDTGLNNIGDDFFQWLQTSKVSPRKQQNIVNYIKTNIQIFQTIWYLVKNIMFMKDQIVEKFEESDLDVKQTMAGQPGGEGFVLANPSGDIKFVSRSKFSALNRSMRA
jgi:hypothetical protein